MKIFLGGALLSRYPIIGDIEIQDYLPIVKHKNLVVLSPHHTDSIQISDTKQITFFAVHLKSRQPLFGQSNKEDPHTYLQGLARSLHLRNTEAIAIQHLVHQCREKDDKIPIFIAGDLNDTESQSVTTQLLCGCFPPYNWQCAIQQIFETTPPLLRNRNF